MLLVKFFGGLFILISVGLILGLLIEKENVNDSRNGINENKEISLID